MNERGHLEDHHGPPPDDAAQVQISSFCVVQQTPNLGGGARKLCESSQNGRVYSLEELRSKIRREKGSCPIRLYYINAAPEVAG